MTEENVFNWDTDKSYQEGVKKLPEWAKNTRKSDFTCSYPEIVPDWVRGDYQVGMEYEQESYLNSACISLHVRVRFPNGGRSKWMHYMDVLMRDVYLIPRIVEYLLSGNAERVYVHYVKERKWKNRRRGKEQVLEWTKYTDNQWNLDNKFMIMVNKREEGCVMLELWNTGVPLVDNQSSVFLTISQGYAHERAQMFMIKFKTLEQVQEVWDNGLPELWLTDMI